MTLSLICICLAQIIFWFKGNAKVIYGLNWTPLHWWLTTSLITNYLTLFAWWRMIDSIGVWRAGAYWGGVAVFIDLILNCIYFGFDLKGVIALLLIALAGIIVHL